MSKGKNTFTVLYQRISGYSIAVAAAAIVFLSVLPLSSMKEDPAITTSSKGYGSHLAAYALLAILTYAHGLLLNRPKILLKTAVWVFLFSALLETIQLFIPYRSFNPYDLLANAMGVGSGLAAGYLFFNKLNLLTPHA